MMTDQSVSNSAYSFVDITGFFKNFFIKITVSCMILRWKHSCEFIFKQSNQIFSLIFNKADMILGREVFPKNIIWNEM